MRISGRLLRCVKRLPMGKDMDCKEFEKLIPDFIHRKLDYLTLKRFSEHMALCGNCKEELEIQFLVTEGIQRLEEGGAFDLQSELEQRLEEAKRSLQIHGRILRFGIMLEILAAVLMAGIVVWLFV